MEDKLIDLSKDGERIVQSFLCDLFLMITVDLYGCVKFWGNIGAYLAVIWDFWGRFFLIMGHIGA